MAKLGHTHETALKKYDYNRTGNGYKIHIKYSRLGRRLDKAQQVLDTQVWQDVQQYMPIQNGANGGLIGETNTINAVTSGKVYLYPPDSKYGHYQNEGIVYVDPVYGVAGWQRDDGTWYSRAGITKVPSNRTLKYSNPKATSHWGETAIKNHMKEWQKLVKRWWKW